MIEGACRRGARPSGRCAIRVQGCSRLDILGNTVDPTRQEPRFTEPLIVTPASH